MESKKKNTSTKEETAPQEAKRSPAKAIREGDVSVSIWTREFNGLVFYSCTFERSYTDAKGQRKYTHSFGLHDLGTLVKLAQQAADWIGRAMNKEGLHE
jgi:hypothetical protein